jgi:carboxypeptidase family protein
VGELNCIFSRFGRQRFSSAAVALLFLGIASLIATAQTSSTGTIVGTVTDQSGAVVSGAKVMVTNLATNQTANFTTTSSGLYDAGPLVPGRYKVNVEAKSLKAPELVLTVEVGVLAIGNVRLDGGQGNKLAEVQRSTFSVNTEQATVQNVVTAQQIEILPINGRNFLDLAQLAPGVQIEDGSGFDPTKNGFLSVSIGGRAGRTARIELDGIDISDENVGTTTQNISATAIQEFQVAQSSLDLSSSITSSGTLNVTSKSGSNGLHGQGTYFFRDQAAGFAKFPGGQAIPYQRNQPGGNVGGPIIKDKLFFFADVQHTKQDFQNAVVFPGNFASLSGAYNAPSRDTEYLGKLDYVFRHNAHLFYRFTYNDNSVLRPSSDFSPFLNRDNTQGHALGLDFNTGSLTHSLRFGYGKFWNGISPASGGGIYDPFPSLNIVIGALVTGPNNLAPQVTIQSNKQARYDGSKPWKNHIFRYGFAVNRIAAGGFAAFGADAPTVTADPANTSNLGTLIGAATNPLNYAVTGITVANGRGFFSEKPSFGYPGGGNSDTRIEFYAGDVWKMRPNLTLSYGLHYVRDTGRTDSDLAPIPCSATTLISCNGNLLDQFGYGGLGNRVHQPNKNFGPQVGFAWDPSGKGTTVFRGGVGLYYENNLFNNTLFDRTVRLQKAQVFGSMNLCPSGNLPWPDGSVHTTSDGLDIASQICGQPIGATVNGVVVGSAIADLQHSYESAVAAAGPTSNPFFVGNNLNTFGSLLAPTYVSPRSVQMNLGFQKQIKRGTILSVDYVRNVGTHFLLGVDTNQVGDSRNLNVGAAQAAIAATTQSYNCGGGYSEAAVQCAIAGGATIINFAKNGLDSANAYCGGFPCALFGLPNAAFGGINPNVGANEMFFPVGRSLYTGIQTSLRSDVQSPFRGATHMNLQISYAFSKFQNNVPTGGSTIQGDQDFLTAARDYRSPNRFFGPAGQDRKHQLSFGAIIDLVKGFQLSGIGHIDSPLPLTLFLPQEFQGGDIFISDVTGDGTVGDIVPGSNVGSFGRSVSPSGLNHFVSNYLTTSGGHLTPAGQALVNAGVMTQQDLVSLGATTPVSCSVGQQGFLSNGIPCINTPPGSNAGLGWLKSIDLRLAWTLHIKERVSLQPSVMFYNAFNFANFDGPANLPSGILGGTPGYNINNLTNFSACTSCNAKQSTRIGPGSGTFSFGAPREAEFAINLTF